MYVKQGHLLDCGKKIEETQKMTKTKVKVKTIKKLYALLKERQKRWLNINILPFH